MLLKNRGPNAQSEWQITEKDFELMLVGYVLWQQGSKLCTQPHSFKDTILLLNGDIYSHRDDTDQSDTDWLAENLSSCQSESDLLKFLQELEGPYSIIFYDRINRNLYFVRDSLGRHTLLLGVDGNNGYHFSSVFGLFEKYLELPGFYNSY